MGDMEEKLPDAALVRGQGVAGGVIALGNSRERSAGADSGLTRCNNCFLTLLCSGRFVGIGAQCADTSNCSRCAAAAARDTCAVVYDR